MSESLSLWNETPAKKAVIDYVNVVTNPKSAEFVPETERIAILDNDGTMWVEKPTYVQLFFAIERLKQLAEADPKLLDQPHFKAAATGDLAYFSKLDPHTGGNHRCPDKHRLGRWCSPPQQDFPSEGKRDNYA